MIPKPSTVGQAKKIENRLRFEIRQLKYVAMCSVDATLMEYVGESFGDFQRNNNFEGRWRGIS